MEEATKEFNRPLEAEKSSSHASLGLARIALTTGNLEAARTNLEKALESNPKHGEVHGLLSEVYRRLNMPDDANHLASLALNPNSVYSMNNLASGVANCDSLRSDAAHKPD